MYVIVGGSRGIGLEITPWMADKGARHFILVSRSGPQTAVAQDIIDALIARGVRVDLCQCNIGSQADVEQHLTPLLKSIPRVGGVIFGPMILRVRFLSFVGCILADGLLGCDVRENDL